MRTRLHKRVSRMIRGRFRKGILSRHGVGVVAETRNGLYVVDPGDYGVSRQLLRDGAYDLAEVQWLIDALDGKAGTVVVAGAHIGALLIPLARIAGRAIAFEPDPSNYRLAGWNMLLNRVENVTLVNKALGSEAGWTGIRHNSINTGNSSVERRGARGTIDVEMTTLDRALAGLSVTDVDLLVVDVEGHETQVLRGGSGTLGRTRHLYLEYAPEQLAEHGSMGRELIDAAFENFDYLYLFDDRVRSLDRAAVRAHLVREGHRRGFLKNLLFSKARLGDRALGHTR